MKMRFSTTIRYAAGLLFIVGLVAGCSGIKPYPNMLEKNVQIRTTTETGSTFSKIRVAIDIYRVDAQCKLEYQGSVNLDQPLIAVGLPPDRLTYLVFSFTNSTFLGGAGSTIGQQTLLKPRAGNSYDIAVSYKDDMYNVVIRENRPKSVSREIQLVRLTACKEQ